MGLYSGSNNDVQEAQKAAEKASDAYPDFNNMDQRIHRFVDKVLDSKLFDRNNWGPWGLNSHEFFDWEFFDNMKKGNYIAGTKAYPIPSVSQYQKCKDAGGLGVWDQNGWWRCAFPRAQVTDPKELTREDVEGDNSNQYGLFFTEFNSLLDWKLHVKKLVKEKEEQLRVQRETETLNDIYADYEKDVDWYGDDGLVSTSRAIHYQTLPNGDAEEVTEIQNRFKDGRTENKKFKKLIPKDGSPIIEQLGDNSKDSKLMKWIWDNEKK